MVNWSINPFSTNFRLANPKDQDTLEHGGKKLGVEWIPFDEHFFKGRSPITFYALQCSSSFLVPCTFNQSALSEEEKKGKAPAFKGKPVPGGEYREVLEGGYEVEGPEGERDWKCNSDYYYDQQLAEGEGKGAGRSFGYGMIPCDF